MTYQPDPTLVRECATRIIQDQIEEIRDLGQMDIDEKCEDEIDALHYASDMTTHEAHDASDVLIDAVRNDIRAAAITATWPEVGDDFPVITICGSMRFFERMMEIAREMTARGIVVLMPFDASLTGIANKTATEHGAMLDAMHRAKIRLSQSVYVVNGGGYIGESTRSEIEYATGLGLPVEYDDETAA